MKNLQLACHQCFSHAEDHFREGSKEVGTALFVEGARRLDDVLDPIQWLALTLRAERIVHKYLLPSAV